NSHSATSAASAVPSTAVPAPTPSRSQKVLPATCGSTYCHRWPRVAGSGRSRAANVATSGTSAGSVSATASHVQAPGHCLPACTFHRRGCGVVSAVAGTVHQLDRLGLHRASLGDVDEISAVLAPALDQ